MRALEVTDREDRKAGTEWEVFSRNMTVIHQSISQWEHPRVAASGRMRKEPAPRGPRRETLEEVRHSSLRVL